MGKGSTNAARQRRYIARLKAAAKAAGVTNADEVAALRKQLAEAPQGREGGPNMGGVTNADEMAAALRKQLAKARAASLSFLLAAANTQQLEREQGIADVHGTELENLLAVILDNRPAGLAGGAVKGDERES